MTFLNASLIRKLTLFLAAAMFSVSAIAIDFDQNQRLANQGDVMAQHNLRSLRVNDSNVGIVSTKVADYSQDVVLKKYNIPSLGQISIPTNMELPAGEYKELNKEYRQVLSDQI